MVTGTVPNVTFRTEVRALFAFRSESPRWDSNASRPRLYWSHVNSQRFLCRSSPEPETLSGQVSSHCCDRSARRSIGGGVRRRSH